MNLLFVANLFKPGGGGIAELSHQLAVHLAKRGNGVTVLSRMGPGARDFDAKANYAVRRFSEVRSHFYLRPLVPLSVSWRIASEVRQAKADVIVATSAWSWLSICQRVSQIYKVPLVVLVHGNDLDMPSTSNGRRKLAALQRADLVISNSDFVRSKVLSLGVEPSRAITIPPGVSDTDFAVPEVAKAAQLRMRLGINGNPMVLSVGRLVERKGHDQVIRAMPHILAKVPGAVYVIVGEGDAAPALRKLAQAEGVAASVILVGAVTDAERQAYYDACSVFAMPSRQASADDVEGFGIVYLEANARERPVVAGRSGGVDDAVVNGVTGLVVDPLSAAEIAGAISLLLQDKDHAALLGQQGRKRAEQHFSWQEIASRHIKALEHVTHARPPALHG